MSPERWQALKDRIADRFWDLMAQSTNPLMSRESQTRRQLLKSLDRVVDEAAGRATVEAGLYDPRPAEIGRERAASGVAITHSFSAASLMFVAICMVMDTVLGVDELASFVVGLNVVITRRLGQVVTSYTDYLVQESVRGTTARKELTPREMEVVGCLVRSGGSNRLIARELGIAEPTVQRHLHNIYEKLGVHNRAQMIQAAQRYGLG